MDWSGWMELSAEQQAERMRRYKAEIKAESDASRSTDYREMNVAMRVAALSQGAR